MSILLPGDDNGNPIHVLGFDYRGTQKLMVSTTASIRNPEPIAGDIELVTLIATGPCRFEIGDATVTADPARSPFSIPASMSTFRSAAASATSPLSPRPRPARPI